MAGSTASVQPDTDGQQGRRCWGSVVRACPSGPCQVTVPSGNIDGRQRACCLKRWWRRQRSSRPTGVVAPSGQGFTWSRSQRSAGLEHPPHPAGAVPCLDELGDGLLARLVRLRRDAGQGAGLGLQDRPRDLHRQELEQVGQGGGVDPAQAGKVGAGDREAGRDLRQRPRVVAEVLGRFGDPGQLFAGCRVEVAVPGLQAPVVWSMIVSSSSQSTRNRSPQNASGAGRSVTTGTPRVTCAVTVTFRSTRSVRASARDSGTESVSSTFRYSPASCSTADHIAALVAVGRRRTSRSARPHPRGSPRTGPASAAPRARRPGRPRPWLPPSAPPTRLGSGPSPRGGRELGIDPTTGLHVEPSAHASTTFCAAIAPTDPATNSLRVRGNRSPSTAPSVTLRPATPSVRPAFEAEHRGRHPVHEPHRMHPLHRTRPRQPHLHPRPQRGSHRHDRIGRVGQSLRLTSQGESILRRQPPDPAQRAHDPALRTPSGVPRYGSRSSPCPCFILPRRADKMKGSSTGNQLLRNPFARHR